MLNKRCLYCSNTFSSHLSDNRLFCNLDCYTNYIKNHSKFLLIKDDVRRLYLSGFPMKKIAKIYGSSTGLISKCVSDIVRPRNYRTVFGKGFKGKACSEENKKRISELHKGRKKSYETRKKLSKANLGKKLSEDTRIKISLSKTGEKEFTGFKTSKMNSLRHTIEYKTWRLMVFGRDNFTCQKCGKRGCYLEPHHIKSFSEFPELRFDINNGITLCDYCHVLEDKFRRRFIKK